MVCLDIKLFIYKLGYGYVVYEGIFGNFLGIF